MKKYFEFGLTENDLAHISYEKMSEFGQAFYTLKGRMEKLNEALRISQLKGEAFAMILKPLFDNSFDRFEKMTVEELASYARLGYDPKKDYPTRLDFPNATVVFDTAFVSTKEWEMVRHVGIGGSDAAVVLGASPYNTPRNLYYSKTATPELLRDKDEKKEMIFARGHFIEDAVIDGYCKLSGATRVYETRMFRSKKYPMLLANIDAILRLSNGEYVLFEAKTTVSQNYDAWNRDTVPVQYLPQGKQYLGVLDDERIKQAYIGCIFVDDVSVGNTYCGSAFNEERSVFRKLSYEKDELDKQLSKEAAWWNKHVLGGELPPKSSDADAEAKTLLTYEIGEPDAEKKVELKEGKIGAITTYLNIQTDMKEAKTKYENLYNQLKLAQNTLLEIMGNASEATLDYNDSMFILTHKRTKGRQSCDLEKLRIAYPEAFKECVTEGEGYLRFNLKSKSKALLNKKKK